MMQEGEGVREGPEAGPGQGAAGPGRGRLPVTALLFSCVALVASAAAVGLSLHAGSRRATTPTVAAVSTVGVTERDFAIEARPAAVRGGLVDFAVSNAGPSPHEFLVFRADMDPGDLPLGTDGRVDESSDRITKVFDSGDNISPNGSKVFHAALVPGRYVLVCNLPGHYRAGMHTDLTVN